jgi:hypothetical protein
VVHGCKERCTPVSELMNRIAFSLISNSYQRLASSYIREICNLFPDVEKITDVNPYKEAKMLFLQSTIQW